MLDLLLAITSKTKLEKLEFVQTMLLGTSLLVISAPGTGLVPKISVDGLILNGFPSLPISL